MGATAFWYSKLSLCHLSFPTDSLYTPMDNAPLLSIPSVRRLWGGCLLLRVELSKARLQGQAVTRIGLLQIKVLI